MRMGGAVVADVIDAVKHANNPKRLFWEGAVPNYVEDSTKEEFSFLLRFETQQKAALSARLAEVFGELTIVDGPEGEVAVATAPLSESELNTRLSALTEAAPVSCLRIASL